MLSAKAKECCSPEYHASNNQMLSKLRAEKQKTLSIEHEMSKTYDVFVQFFEGRKLVLCFSHEGRADVWIKQNFNGSLLCNLTIRSSSIESIMLILMYCDLTKMVELQVTTGRSHTFLQEPQNV